MTRFTESEVAVFYVVVVCQGELKRPRLKDRKKNTHTHTGGQFLNCFVAVFSHSHFSSAREMRAVFAIWGTWARKERPDSC